MVWMVSRHALDGWMVWMVSRHALDGWMVWMVCPFVWMVWMLVCWSRVCWSCGLLVTASDQGDVAVTMVMAALMVVLMVT